MDQLLLFKVFPLLGSPQLTHLRSFCTA
uniref:Uncharacterized protein n=1 Tax=Anguilla anguilla TaxID=7936 RepID=A0A0E9Q587_ANGAN